MYRQLEIVGITCQLYSIYVSCCCNCINTQNAYLRYKCVFVVNSAVILVLLYNSKNIRIMLILCTASIG